MTGLLRAEWMRVSLDQPRIGLFIGLVFVYVTLMITGTSPVDPELNQRMLEQVAFFATFYGAASSTTARQSGVLARTVLFAHRTPVLGAMVLVTALSGVGFGVAITALVSWRTFGLALPWAPLVGAVSALLGMFVGIIVRSTVLTMMVAVLVHIGSLVALSSWPSVGRQLPLGVTAVPAGAVAWVAWLVVLGTLAWLVMIRRDVV